MSTTTVKKPKPRFGYHSPTKAVLRIGDKVEYRGQVAMPKVDPALPDTGGITDGPQTADQLGIPAHLVPKQTIFYDVSWDNRTGPMAQAWTPETSLTKIP